MLKRLSGLLTLVMFAFVAMSSTAHAHTPAPIEITEATSPCHDTDAASMKTHAPAKSSSAQSSSDCADSCDCALTHCPATTGLMGSPLLGESPMIYATPLSLPRRDDSHVRGRMVDALERPPRA